MSRKTLLTLFSIFICQAMIAQIEVNQTTYYLIRHAEKLQSNPSDLDPDLSAKGILRAHKWNDVFNHISFDEIYATNYKRTIKTIENIAKKHQLDINIYHPKNINFNDFKESTKNKTVLIVGHSNTIPNFVNALIEKNKYPEIEDDNNSNLYIVTIKNGAISDVLLKIDVEN